MATLAAEYGVARSTVVAALRRMEADGLVTIVSNWGTWEQRVVPGLLQTEEYARSVIKAGQPRISPDELERKVTS